MYRAGLQDPRRQGGIVWFESDSCGFGSEFRVVLAAGWGVAASGYLQWFAWKCRAWNKKPFLPFHAQPS